MRLAGHHALVTGGGTGIGAAIARVLAAEGAKLTLVGRRSGPLDETATTLRSSRAKARGDCTEAGETPLDYARDEPEGVECIQADVSDRKQVEAAFASAGDAHGPITILVNNAGAADSAPFSKVTAESWRRIMAVNLDALLHCTQAALPDLMQAQDGRIITIASTAGLKGYAYSAPYCAAKHGAVGFTRAVALELAATNVTVNAVCPGFTDTGMVAEAVETIRIKTGRSAEEARAELAKFNPQRRLVSPEDVASAVLWLCLPESRSVTGQAIAVAGGEVQ